MGQRSQIYVRYEKEGKNYLTAKYFQWNYGERMVSRCRWTLEWIKEMLPYDWYLSTEKETLMRYMDVNFDMKSVVLGQDIVKDYNEDNWWKEDGYSFNDCIFHSQDNNDGKLFIHVKDGVIKYAFLDCDCDTEKVMNAKQYMDWDCDGWQTGEFLDDEDKKTLETNFAEIEKLAALMTQEEVENFLDAVYEEDPQKPF